MAINEQFYDAHKADSRGRVRQCGPLKLEDIQAANILHCATAVEGLSDEERVIVEFAARILFEIRSGEPDMQEIKYHADKISGAVE